MELNFFREDFNRGAYRLIYINKTGVDLFSLTLRNLLKFKD